MKKIIYAVAIVAMLGAGNLVYAQAPSKKADAKTEQTMPKKAHKAHKSHKATKAASSTEATASKAAKAK